MKEPEWFVKTWNWKQSKQEYIPLLTGYYTEAEARDEYKNIIINDDTIGASLIYGGGNEWRIIEWKPE